MQPVPITRTLMVATQSNLRLTPQEYFEWEARQAIRYEYFAGEVFAMTGGSIPHAEIALNFASFLRDKLQSRINQIIVGIAASIIVAPGPVLHRNIARLGRDVENAAKGCWLWSLFARTPNALVGKHQTKICQGCFLVAVVRCVLFVKGWR